MEREKQGCRQGFYQPTRYFLCAGTGEASQGLVAFDRALIEAGVGDVNLVKLSSIIGPGCGRVEAFTPSPGSFVGVAFARCVSTTPGQRIASAVAVAHPTDVLRASVVMEYSGEGIDRETAERKVIDMATEAMKSRGLEVRAVESIGAEHTVSGAGATFAAVVEV
jgi:arginine decarboxylase